MRGSRKTVRRKLTELILGTCFCVLAVTLVGLVAYEVHSYRQTTARGLSTIAEIVAENSAAVLIFDDKKLAYEILGGLRAEQEVSAAALFDPEGKLYATYPPELSTSSFPLSPQPDGVNLGLRELTIWKPVMQEEKRVGTIYFRGNLSGTYQRIGVFALVLVLIGAVSVFVAVALSHFLQRRISQPLADLAGSARKVTSDRDYTIRAEKISEDEFGDLTDAFNSMLDQIHASNVALHEQEERFRTLADNMVQLAWMTDEKGKFRWYNKRWYDYTGLDFDSSKEKGWEKVHPDHRDRLRSKMQMAFETGGEWEDTFPLLGHDGEYRWFLSHAIPIRNADQKVQRWFGTNTDVTEFREVQQDLQRARDEAVAASRAKDDFLARLSHELRTPLNPVLLIVSDEERNQSLSAELSADFETIKNNIELEARLIDDLLDLTAIARGKLVLHRRRVLIEDVVREALLKIRAEAAQRNVAVRLKFAAPAAFVECDPVRVQQAFWNILKNAVKFSPEGGMITVETSVTGDADKVSISVSDNGIGMSPGEIAKVFDAFAQGDHAAAGGSHRFGGLGLGLAISSRVIELHSGRIVALSPGRDLGSTFVVELPLADGAQPPARATNSRRAHLMVNGSGAGRRLSVLLVEDHEPTRTTLERLLARRNYDVLSAGSATEAQVMFPQRAIDVLISDIGLPDGSGFELMQDFGGRAVIAGIALTGYGMEADVARTRAAGFCVHLTKPVRVESLDHALATAVKALEEQRRGAVHRPASGGN